MISLVLKYLNPLWYPYGIMKGLIMSPYYLVCSIYWLVSKLVAATKYGWNMFEPWYMKVIMSLIMLWCAWPMTNTWLFGVILSALGFEEEVNYVLELVYGVLIAAYRGLIFVWEYVDPTPTAIAMTAITFVGATFVSWLVRRRENK